MKRSMFVFAAAAALVVAVSWAQDAPSTRAPATAPTADIGQAHAQFVQAAERLVEGMRSDQYKVRNDSAAALAALHEEYVRAIVAHVSDADPELTARLRGVLAGMSVAMEAQRMLAELGEAQRAKVAQFREGFPAVAAKVFSKDEGVCAEGVREIGALEDAQCLAEPLLLRSLRSESSQLAVAAAQTACCGRYASDEVVDALTALLGRGPWWGDMYGTNCFSAVVAEALKRIGSTRAAAALVGMIVQDEYQDMDWTATLADALVATGEKRAIPHLLPLLSRADETGEEVFARGPFGPMMPTGMIGGWVTVSDVILMALVKLTGQDPAAYGLAPMPSPGSGMIRYGCGSHEAREKARKKFLQWWRDNEKTAPYKDLKPLDLPKPPPDAGEEGPVINLPPGIFRGG